MQMEARERPETTAFFTSSDGQRIDSDSTCTVGGVTVPVPETGLRGYRAAPLRMWAALVKQGYEPATDHYSDMRRVEGGVEMDIRPLTITLYKANADSVYVGVGNDVWDLGNSPDRGAFATLAAEWLAEEWWDMSWMPATSVAVRTNREGLTPVATWDRFNGVRLLVAGEHLGFAAESFLGLSD